LLLLTSFYQHDDSVHHDVVAGVAGGAGDGGGWRLQ